MDLGAGGKISTSVKSLGDDWESSDTANEHKTK